MSDNSLNRLDRLETSITSQPPDMYRDFVIEHHFAEMNAAYNIYRTIDHTEHQRNFKALQECRASAWFVRNIETGQVRVTSKSCKLRWCPMCSAARRWHLTKQVSEWLKTAEKPKFLTLTFQHFDIPLVDQINNLYNCFKTFRKKKFFRKECRGGVWFFQIKKSKNDNLWHPHLHCLIDSEWIVKDDISKAWEVITEGSKIVDIKGVTDESKVAEYVARYSAKPSLLSTLELDDQFEIVSVLHGRRLVGTWGSARSISLRPSKPPDAADWHTIGSWFYVVNSMRSDTNASAIWNAWKNNKPLEAGVTMAHIEDGLLNAKLVMYKEPLESNQILLDFR